MRIYLCLLILVLAIQANGQHKYDYTWMFGPWKGYGTMLLFGESINIVNNVEYAFDISKGATMISDKEGNLQYYSSGCRIADSDHEIIFGADTLNPGWYYENWCFDGLPPGLYVVQVLGRKGSRWVEKVVVE